MKGLLHEWVEKAEGDFQSAQRELRAHKAPNYDAACFHSQQCAEKYLKALLIHRGKGFRAIHDLEVLLDLIVPICPDLEALRDSLLLLNDYAVDIRYPGESASRDEARAAVKAMRMLRVFVRSKLRPGDQQAKIR
jgi:HEPN domain-containing protein